MLNRRIDRREVLAAALAMAGVLTAGVRETGAGTVPNIRATWEGTVYDDQAHVLQIQIQVYKQTAGGKFKGTISGFGSRAKFNGKIDADGVIEGRFNTRFGFRRPATVEFRLQAEPTGVNKPRFIGGTFETTDPRSPISLGAVEISRVI